MTNMKLHGKMCSKWKTRVLRWTVKTISWTTYIFCRSFVVGQIKYDTNTGIIIIRPRNPWTKRIALLFKAFMLYRQFSALFYSALLVVVIWFPGNTETDVAIRHLLGNMVVSIVLPIAFWNMYRLYRWLSSSAWNQSFVLSANEVIKVISLIEQALGPLSLEAPSLLIIYVIELVFTVTQIVNFIQAGLSLLILYIVLLVLLYNVYVAYLLLLLSWIASFNHFLGSYHCGSTPSRKQRKKLLQLLRLYSRISNGHQDIIVMWLPVASALFSDIVMLVCHWASIFNIILFNHDLDARDKWNVIVWGHLGSGLAPFLRILLIGLFNDRLTQLERLLSWHLLIIDLNQHGDDLSGENFAGELQKLQTCFDLQLRVQPIRNPIMSVQQMCGCDFVLQFVVCTLLNSLNYLQYGMANGIVMFDFQGILEEYFHTIAVYRKISQEFATH